MSTIRETETGQAPFDPPPHPSVEWRNGDWRAKPPKEYPVAHDFLDHWACVDGCHPRWRELTPTAELKRLRAELCRAPADQLFHGWKRGCIDNTDPDMAYLWPMRALVWNAADKMRRLRKPPRKDELLMLRLGSFDAERAYRAIEAQLLSDPREAIGPLIADAIDANAEMWLAWHEHFYANRRFNSDLLESNPQ
jgi:hypothetical protein